MEQETIEVVEGSISRQVNPQEEQKKRKKKHKEKASKKVKVEEVQINYFLQEEGVKRDFLEMTLKKDHESRPLWVCPSYLGNTIIESEKHFIVILETFSQIYQQAYDFLVAIAEPESRPQLIHEYKVTSSSLFAAVSIGLRTEQILEVLDKLSKVNLTEEIIDFVKASTSVYGKVVLVLKNNHYFVESTNPEYLDTLLKDSLFQKIKVSEEKSISKDPVDIKTGYFIRERIPDLNLIKRNEDILQTNKDEDVELIEKVYSFEIDTSVEKIEKIKERSQQISFPMTEYYDYLNDLNNPSLDIDLKSEASVSIRSYQEKCLSKMFSGDRARSGIIVLPCGAGKTLVGITAVSTIKKNSLIVCNNNISLQQWYDQFLQWTKIDRKKLVRWTSQFSDTIPKKEEACIIFSTYSMLSKQGKRAESSQTMIEMIENREWGILVLDEVHQAPASGFKEITTKAKAHCKLGLTATLLREDDKIPDLHFLVGPKLYEANWMDLQQQGYLANVQCVEVLCEMTTDFFKEYLTSTKDKQKLFYWMNPSKFKVVDFLIRYHEQRDDKIIIFIDNIFTLKHYAEKLKKPYLHGETPYQERLSLLSQFKFNKNLKTIFMSIVGDVAIDLPNANILIQVASNFGSRRQEAQRLGRILRPKGGEKSGFNGFFYSLISNDTRELFFSAKRQTFLLDQGFSFKVVSGLEKIEWGQRLSDINKMEELELIQEIQKEKTVKDEKKEKKKK